MVLGSSAAFALLPPLAKIAYDHGADPRGLLALRFGVGAPVFIALVGARRRTALSLNAFPVAALPSLLFFCSNWAFFGSINRTSAVIAVLVFFSYPILVALGGSVFLGERLTAVSGGLILLGAVGVYLSVGVTGTASASGMALAATAAFAFACFFLRAKQLLAARRLDGIALTAWTTIFAGVGFPILMVVSGGAFPDDAPGYLAIAAIALLGTAVAGTLLYTGLDYLDAGTAAMLTAIEPPLTVVFTVLLLSEDVTSAQLAGLGVVLVSITGLGYLAVRR
jgi:drug/metabolite transporter (DMT)-like permease